MISRTFLSFGGLNVVIGGDFHQFPPVCSRKTAPLYWPASTDDSNEEAVGSEFDMHVMDRVQRSIFRSFGLYYWDQIIVCKRTSLADHGQTQFL